MTLRIWLAFGLLVAGLSACGPLTGDDSEDSMTGDANDRDRYARTETRTPPEGAIDTGNGVYMVPVSKTDTGCVQYTPWSATAAVVTAIHYRRADGTFTMNRDEADCTG
ncbi:MAG: hypothetical protein R3C97_02770 [Geminicoccaceae bacterium]